MHASSVRAGRSKPPYAIRKRWRASSTWLACTPLAFLRFVSGRITDFELCASPGAPAGPDFRWSLMRLAMVEAGARAPLRAAPGG